MATQSQGNDLFWVVAGSSAIILSMTTTWFLVDRYPALESKSAVLALLFVFSVVFLNPFLIYRLLRRDLRKGYKVAAISSAGLLVLVSLLVAALVGLLLWFISSAKPWELIIVVLCVSEILSAVGAWLVWRGRKNSLKAG